MTPVREYVMMVHPLMLPKAHWSLGNIRVGLRAWWHLGWQKPWTLREWWSARPWA